VDDSRQVRRVQCVGGLGEPGECFLLWRDAVPEPVGDAASGGELHDDVRPPVPLADVVDRDDVRVVCERGRQPGLAEEPPAHGRVGAIPGGEDLDGNLAAERRVEGGVNLGHPACADRAHARISVRKRRHRGLSLRGFGEPTREASDRNACSRQPGHPDSE
jgi:hypothetical protein